MIRVNNIKLSIHDDTEVLMKKALRQVKISSSEIRNFRIIKESVDARKKNNIMFVYNVEFECNNESKVVKKSNSKDVVLEDAFKNAEIIFGDKRNKLINRPIIVGSGPAGLFAGLLMAKNGYNPIILERGSSVEKRTEKIKKFWETGELDPDCNVQFGEGGAGTFSDGKLTTRIKDPKCDYVIEEFVKAGAPPEIAYSFKPHIGTDILKKVVMNIRNKIIDYGGEIRFDSKVTNIGIKDGKLERVTINDDYELPCEVAVFALGHSARDTYDMLFKGGVKFEQKSFAIGVRIEHLQSMIDISQYGELASHPKLRAADYRLAYTARNTKRACYSFCMCPGGLVVAAASEHERLVTNGMSEYNRDKANANSALVVSIHSDDFKSEHPLAGIEFQRHYENLAYIEGGRSYRAPIQLVGDFLKDTNSSRIYEVEPSYTRGYEFGDLRNCLPNYVVETLKEGLMDFNNKIKGFARFDAVLTGNETRTSSPVRMPRNESFESVNVKGIYPAGEGAGYAGGIVSAAVDGLKVAEQIIRSFNL